MLSRTNGEVFDPLRNNPLLWEITERLLAQCPRANDCNHCTVVRQCKTWFDRLADKPCLTTVDYQKALVKFNKLQPSLFDFRSYGGK
jgi:hypothetical protein